jgi:pilus assembly protein Flp/PilA
MKGQLAGAGARQNQIELGYFRFLAISASFTQRSQRTVLPINKKGLILMTTLFKQFLRNEAGATAIEYGLIAALIAVVIITGVTAVGTKLSTTFVNLSGTLR